MSIRWLPQAQRNRLEQLDYIAQDNPLAAIRQDEQIERQINILVTHPKMGRPGRVAGTRELVISGTPFVVIYRLQGPNIEVLRLLHSAQQWP
ncbi:MAG: type II toxin-antitoxin system RelE/ParE family toxin [Betaproteobacteria bacterium]|nr:type II toxin-antitoxin system RelE/ParE family toxin [Betaproteobacteria bacterium]